MRSLESTSSAGRARSDEQGEYMMSNKIFQNAGTGNVPSVNVGEAVARLSDMYCSVIDKGYGVDAVPSVMLWGAPGVGKSQGVRQIASKIEAATGKTVRVTDVRLLLFNPIDLRGIPVASEDRTLAVWLRPKIFDMDPSDEIVNILFLDEISAAPQSVQAAAYQITLDRTVGEHKLPVNCIVIAAGNRVTDKSVAYRMPKALANRLMHLEVTTDIDSWRAWAVSHGINEKVTGFLSFKPDKLMAFDASADDLAFATPRAWEMVSDLLNRVSDDIDSMFTLIAGIVGSGTAAEFRTWSRIYDKLPSVEGIFRGTEHSVPRGVDALYALVCSMAKYASEHRNDMDAIANSIAYAEQLPPDFSVVLMQDYMHIEEGYKDKLMGLPGFIKWVRSRGTLLNGIR